MKTNWKKLINPDYLGAYSLDDGNEKYNDLIVSIRNIKTESVAGPDGKKETCPVAYFDDNNLKPMVLNSTNMKTLEKLFKSKYIEDWAGGKIQLFVAPVKAFGGVVDALRIRPYRPESKAPEKPICADCSTEIKGFGKYDAKYIAERNQQKYGKPLCADCAQKRADKEKAEKVVDPLAEPEQSEPEQNNSEQEGAEE